jgi:exopolysaccharide biosynthesis protein
MHVRWFDWARRSALAVGLVYVAVLGPARGEVLATNRPFAGITWHAETRREPPTRLFVAEVDLSRPSMHLRVAAGGADPDGPGRWQTTLMPPTQIAAREHFDLVINGDFFEARNAKDAEGSQSGYRAGMWAAVTGPAVTDGKVWSPSASNRPCLVVHKDRTVKIETLGSPTADDWEVVSGNTVLVKDGVVVRHENTARHPRTAVGLDAKGTTLVLLVVDGRKPGAAVGMSYDELGAEMLRLGCRQALNLDGGGSSIMAVREPNTRRYRTLNAPTDGRERAVANVLGISAGP